MAPIWAVPGLFGIVKRSGKNHHLNMNEYGAFAALIGR